MFRCIYMAVLIEGVSIVVDKATLEQAYPDYAQEVPNTTLTTDDHLARIGFMSEDEAVDYGNKVARLIAEIPGKDVFSSMAIVKQNDGIKTEATWLTFGKVLIVGEHEVSACWVTDDTDPQRVATPTNWKYAESLSDTGKGYSADEFTKRHTFLREEKGIKVYLDNETQEEVFIGKTSL